MKLAAYSHCTLDTIILDGKEYTVPGGAACYCGIAARRLGFDAELFTRFGPDFERKILEDERIRVLHADSDAKTTRFRLEVNGAGRNLYLEQLCDEIPFTSTDSDCTVASPLCGEITSKTFSQILNDSAFVIADPQGFVRRAGSDGRITHESTNLELGGLDALKVNPDEARCLAGCTGEEAMLILSKRGVKYTLYTDGRHISMLSGERVYEIEIPECKLKDTTGVGDIFCSTFACTMVREKDELWAICFAAGAAQAALESGRAGLEKIPHSKATESNASYFYNTVKFRQI